MTAALITALAALIAAGATAWIRGWLARRDATRDADVTVAAARVKEADAVKVADERLAEETKRGAVDAANDKRFD